MGLDNTDAIAGMIRWDLATEVGSLDGLSDRCRRWSEPLTIVLRTNVRRYNPMQEPDSSPWMLSPRQYSRMAVKACSDRLPSTATIPG